MLVETEQSKKITRDYIIDRDKKPDDIKLRGLYNKIKKVFTVNLNPFVSFKTKKSQSYISYEPYLYYSEDGTYFDDISCQNTTENNALMNSRWFRQKTLAQAGRNLKAREAPLPPVVPTIDCVSEDFPRERVAKQALSDGMTEEKKHGPSNSLETFFRYKANEKTVFENQNPPDSPPLSPVKKLADKRDILPRPASRNTNKQTPIDDISKSGPVLKAYSEQAVAEKNAASDNKLGKLSSPDLNETNNTVQLVFPTVVNPSLPFSYIASGKLPTGFTKISHVAQTKPPSLLQNGSSSGERQKLAVSMVTVVKPNKPLSSLKRNSGTYASLLDELKENPLYKKQAIAIAESKSLLPVASVSEFRPEAERKTHTKMVRQTTVSNPHISLLDELKENPLYKRRVTSAGAESGPQISTSYSAKSHETPVFPLRSLKTNVRFYAEVKTSSMVYKETTPLYTHPLFSRLRKSAEQEKGH